MNETVTLIPSSARDSDPLGIGNNVEESNEVDGFQKLRAAIHVENLRDEINLRYLMRQVSTEKLWISIRKYEAKYAPCKPFVSLLAKWHRVQIPKTVSAPVASRRHEVYAVQHRQSGKVKIGFSSEVYARIPKLITLRGAGRGATEVDEVFDMLNLTSIRLADSSVCRAVEQRLHRRYAEFKTAIPAGLRSDAGPTEWFSSVCFEDIRVDFRKLRSLEEKVATWNSSNVVCLLEAIWKARDWEQQP